MSKSTAQPDPNLVEAVARAIEHAISRIPASNPGYISVVSKTLRNVLSCDLLERISDVATTAAIPLIERATLEKAAKAAEARAFEIADAIRRPIPAQEQEDGCDAES